MSHLVLITKYEFHLLSQGDCRFLPVPDIPKFKAGDTVKLAEVEEGRLTGRYFAPIKIIAAWHQCFRGVSPNYQIISW
jgi:hypothetical protein